MVWKPKEKELTREEAVALARKELAPFWHGSPPLLAGVRAGSQFSAHILDEAFEKRPWLIFCVDPTNYDAQLTLLLIKEFQRRYANLGLNTLVLVRPVFSYILEPRTIEQWLREAQLQAIVAVDGNGLLCPSLGLNEAPSVALVNGGQRVITQLGARFYEGLEQNIQNFLRTADPGLALLPIFQIPPQSIRDTFRIDFGAQAQQGQIFELTGRWNREAERLVTNDPEASIRIPCGGSSFSVVAGPVIKTPEPPKIVVEADRVNTMDLFSAEDLGFDDEGRAMVHVESTRHYSLCSGLPPETRKVTLLFPEAKEVPVAIYGIRMGRPESASAS